MKLLGSIARTYREAFAGLPGEVWLLCGTSLINRAGTMVLPFFALYLTRGRGLGILEAGRLVALYGLGSVLGSYLGGWLSDRIGSIRTQQASLVLSGIGYFTIIRLESVGALAAAIFVTSVAAEAFRPAVMSAIAHRSPPGLQARSFALLRLAVNVGMAVGPSVGGVLAMYSYSLLFVVDGVTSWLAAAVMLIWLPAVRVGGAEGSGAHTGPARSPWLDGPFLLLTALVGLFAICLFQVFSTLPIYLRELYGLPEGIIGLVFGFNALLIVLFEMVLIHRVEGRNRLPWIGAGAFLVCGGLALLPLGRSLAWAIASTTVWTLGEMLTLPLTNAAVADRAAPATRGRYMGIYTMAFALAFIVAPLGGTWVWENLGPDFVWYVVGLVGLPLWIGAAALARPFRRTA